jgi:hypothetical protein
MPKKTIAIVCDFDDTLCHDSTSTCLASLGVDIHQFWDAEVCALIQNGWDPVPAYFFKMVELAKTSGIKITRDIFLKSAASLIFYPGVRELFGHVRAALRDFSDEWSVEFYLISSGIIDIVSHSLIAHECTDMWAGEFHYDSEGVISFPKRIVSFTDKTRYLFQISKGLIGDDARAEPFDVNNKVSFDEIRIPFANMIYLGDGYTDVPCFALLKKFGGFPIAVYDEGKSEGLKKALRLHRDKRVIDYGRTDYTVGSELFNRIIDCTSLILNR